MRCWPLCSGKRGAPGCMLSCMQCGGAQLWLLFGQVHEVWRCQASLSPGAGCAVCRASRFLLFFFYVSACPRPCSTPALARAPAECQCEHALPPALLTWDPSHTLSAWPRGLERPGHPLATMVPTGLFSSVCLGCIPVLTPAPDLLPAPWAVRPVLGVGSRLDFGETRQAWGPC